MRQPDAGGESDSQEDVNRRLFIKGIKWVSWASKNSRASSSKSRIQQQNQKHVEHKTKQNKTRRDKRTNTWCEEKRTGKRPSVSQRYPVNQSSIIVSTRCNTCPRLFSMLPLAPSLSLSHGYIEPMPLLTLAGLPATMTCEGWDCDDD